MPLWQRPWVRVAVATVIVSFAITAIIAEGRSGPESTPPAGGVSTLKPSVAPATGVTLDSDSAVDTTVSSQALTQTPAPPSEPVSGTDDNAYRLAIIDVNDRVSDELDELTGLLVLPRYGDSAWNADMRTVLEAMSDTARQARTITAPPAFGDAHSTWLEGIDSFDWAAQNMRGAIVGPDEALMGECIDHIETASTRFRAAAALMAEIPPS